MEVGDTVKIKFKDSVYKIRVISGNMARVKCLNTGKHLEVSLDKLIHIF